MRQENKFKYCKYTDGLVIKRAIINVGEWYMMYRKGHNLITPIGGMYVKSAS